MIRVLLLLISLLVISPSFPAGAQDRFGRGGVESEAPVEATWLQKTVSQIAVWQRAFNKELRRDIRAAKDGGSTAIWSILTLSFLYGVFHAAGPGHGKMVTATWFLTRKSDWRAGALMGCTIAAIQAVSALVIVGGMGLVLGLSPRGISQDAVWVEMASYLLVLLLGLLITVRIARGKDSCGHDIGHHDHDHDHRACDHHDHHHHHDHAVERKNLLVTAAAVGVRPCTGALLVLLFTLANGIFWVGVLGTVAMAVGVAITVTLIGTGAIALHRLAARLPSPNTAVKLRLQQGIGLIGALLISLIGAGMLAATAFRQGLF